MKKRMARTLDGNVRALLSSSFRTLDNYDLFFHAFEVAKSCGAEIHTADLSDGWFYMRFIHPEWREIIAQQVDNRRTAVLANPDDVVIPGCSLRNSEVGQGKLEAAPFIFRIKCLNGMVADDAVTRVHLGRDKAEGVYTSEQTADLSDKLVWSQVSDMVRTTFDRDRFRELCDVMRGASKDELVAPTEAVDAVVKQYGFSDAQRQAILNELVSPSTDIDPGRTVWGLVNAVTSLANDIEEADDAHTVQAIGGHLLQNAAQYVEVRRR